MSKFLYHHLISIYFILFNLRDDLILLYSIRAICMYSICTAYITYIYILFTMHIKTSINFDFAFNFVNDVNLSSIWILDCNFLYFIFITTLDELKISIFYINILTYEYTKNACTCSYCDIIVSDLVEVTWLAVHLPACRHAWMYVSGITANIAVKFYCIDICSSSSNMLLQSYDKRLINKALGKQSLLLHYYYCLFLILSATTKRYINLV